MTKNGSQKIKGLKSSVEIMYDKYGIPHIEAKNDDDMMFALGYVMASERLFQMDLLRRIGSGRLSEVLGKDLLKSDIMLRKVGLKRHANFLWAKYKKTAPPHMLAQIDAYFKGVNHYAKTQPLPLEMKVLRYKPEPFTMEDCIAVGGYMALSFAEGFLVDVLYTDLLDELPLKSLDALFNRAAGDPKSIPQSKDVVAYAPSKNYYKNTASVLTKFKKDLSLFHGSNAWLLSGKRTKSGKTILASDPHIAFAQPGTWFEAHIKSPTYENYGHYLPLLPFPGLAHNKDRGWGITMSNSDDLDFYREKFHPKDPSLVMYKGKYVKVKIIKEVIKVKGEDDHVEKVIITPHGPILDNTVYVKQGEPISLKWSYLHPDNNSSLTFYLLSQSKELKDLAPALSHATSPGFNLVFTDSKGNIGWHVMGQIPIKAQPGNGRYILDGASGKDEYKGYLDISDHPHLYNPENGVIVSANYRHQYDGKIPWVGLWQPKNRYMRISSLLNQKEKWSTEELKKVQTEQHITFYKDIVNHILKNTTAKSEVHKKAIKAFKDWDGSSSVTDIGPSIYYTFYQILPQEALLDDLGKERLKIFTDGAGASHFFSRMELTAFASFWDDKETKDKKETQADILQRTFDKSVDFLVEHFDSKNPKDWKWGKLHTVTFNHPIGKFFPLNKIFNVGPFPAGGGITQINNMGHGAALGLSMDVTYGPSTRRLVDFSDTSLSYGILPTGNSGHPTSKHYNDQVEMFLNNKYRDQIMNMDEVKKRKHTKLSLLPL